MGVENVKTGAFILRFFQASTAGSCAVAVQGFGMGRAAADRGQISPLALDAALLERYGHPRTITARHRTEKQQNGQPHDGRLRRRHPAGPARRGVPHLIIAPCLAALPVLQMICAIVVFATIVDYDGWSKINYTMFVGITAFVLAFAFMVLYFVGAQMVGACCVLGSGREQSGVSVASWAEPGRIHIRQSNWEGLVLTGQHIFAAGTRHRLIGDRCFVRHFLAGERNHSTTAGPGTCLALWPGCSSAHSCPPTYTLPLFSLAVLFLLLAWCAGSGRCHV